MARLLEDLSVTTSGRDLDLERGFLIAAERRAGGDAGGFTDRVLARLEHAEAQYGIDSFRTLGAAGLVNELREEALDLGGWGVLLVEVLVGDQALPPARAQRAKELLQQVAVLAVIADELLQRIAHTLGPTSRPQLEAHDAAVT